MRVVVATPEDIPAWLRLAAEVEPMFGPLVEDPSFLGALSRNVVRGSAFCVREADGPPGSPLLGGLLFSAHPPRYQLGWFAVAARARREGVGRLLATHALALVARPAHVSVITWGESVAGGEPARRFYESLGFRPAEMTEPAPDGTTRQIFSLELS
jgi:GNAT superfamily N-acetyltransferase